MKIGIYGDSYADGCDLNSHTWASKLAELLGADHIGYHARAGTPLYWSYQQIVATGHQYDRIILTVTEPMRFPVAVGPNKLFVTGQQGCYQFRAPLRDDLKSWFAISDIGYLDTVQELILRDLQQQFPNIILIPCFKTSFTGARLTAYGAFALYQINQQMIVSLGMDPDQSKWNTKWTENPGVGKVLCHIPWEWQHTLAVFLHRSIELNRPPVAPKLMNLKIKHTAMEHYYKRI